MSDNKKEKLLGIDFGDARTGLALSEATGLLAIGAGCIKCGNLRKTAEEAAEFARNQSVTKIIVGNPLNMNGTAGPRTERCQAFASLLGELTGLEVELFDERLTTVAAHGFLSATGVSGKKRKDSVDELSATLILQDYLDRRKNKR
jgi:putative Holliday junction resolvase